MLEDKVCYSCGAPLVGNILSSIVKHVRYFYFRCTCGVINVQRTEAVPLRLTPPSGASWLDQAKSDAHALAGAPTPSPTAPVPAPTCPACGKEGTDLDGCIESLRQLMRALPAQEVLSVETRGRRSPGTAVPTAAGLHPATPGGPRRSAARGNDGAPPPSADGSPAAHP